MAAFGAQVPDSRKTAPGGAGSAPRASQGHCSPFLALLKDTAIGRGLAAEQLGNGRDGGALSLGGRLLVVEAPTLRPTLLVPAKDRS